MHYMLHGHALGPPATDDRYTLAYGQPPPLPLRPHPEASHLAGTRQDPILAPLPERTRMLPLNIHRPEPRTGTGVRPHGRPWRQALGWGGSRGPAGATDGPRLDMPLLLSQPPGHACMGHGSAVCSSSSSRPSLALSLLSSPQQCARAAAAARLLLVSGAEGEGQSYVDDDDLALTSGTSELWPAAAAMSELQPAVADPLDQGIQVDRLDLHELVAWMQRLQPPPLTHNLHARGRVGVAAAVAPAPQQQQERRQQPSLKIVEPAVSTAGSEPVAALQQSAAAATEAPASGRETHPCPAQGPAPPLRCPGAPWPHLRAALLHAPQQRQHTSLPPEPAGPAGAPQKRQPGPGPGWKWESPCRHFPEPRCVEVPPMAEERLLGRCCEEPYLAQLRALTQLQRLMAGSCSGPLHPGSSSAIAAITATASGRATGASGPDPEPGAGPGVGAAGDGGGAESGARVVGAVAVGLVAVGTGAVVWVRSRSGATLLL